MSEYLHVVRKAWAREHDPATREAYDAMQAARQALAEATDKKAARRVFARAERTYRDAIRQVPIHRSVEGRDS